MTTLICVGACYLDTILKQVTFARMPATKLLTLHSVPYFPEEDSKLRADSLRVRRGGNCPNSLEVLQQLLARQAEHTVKPCLISVLPSRDSPAAKKIIESFGTQGIVDLDRCVYREGHTEAASSYIIRSEATGSRTLVNFNDLPEMTLDEFANATSDIAGRTWWHFEGRIPETTLQCIQYLRESRPDASISVEVEKPGRQGLEELAAEADVVFYSKSWAQDQGYASAEECLEAQSRLTRKAAVGAGDTFIAGMLFALLHHHEDWRIRDKVRFAVQLATSKVQMEGFCGVGAHVNEGLSSEDGTQALV
ncbi:hypothetical protein JX265_011857 [Neoarthrinium moseri]|uniref:Carbohydrate kinase PfkB domain-containing protein n=1 Tax=Neoarthrinium moseri TaxID=1658444 RepID=A0A9P9WBP5_9PEZI|nr:hypothetical protein JX266_006722 [Neoarthrinium moseri]KAI1856142.1 hypothetical protein JX265_011857 [Neoarthrinium moseri]